MRSNRSICIETGAEGQRLEVLVLRAAILALTVIGISAGRAAADDSELRLNQIQVIGTHNSYHIAPAAGVLELIAAAGRQRAEALDYTHRPLTEQFSKLGIRQIELDVFSDPKGGHYANPSARRILEAQGKDPGPDPDANGRLREPGLKVFHVQDVDYRTTVTSFSHALCEVAAWSEAHPRHVPILVLIELKDEPIVTLPTRPVRFTKAELDNVDSAIRAVFKGSAILTPNEVRGEFSSLPEAIRTRGWPTLEATRGRVLFALDNEDRLRDLYLEGHQALQGRAMFVSVAPTHSAAAWMKVNDAVKDFDRIQTLVRSGFLVRTRADADTREARRNDTGPRDKALASGAQFVSTDYPEPRASFSDYRVAFPGGAPARLNPVSGGPHAVSGDVERLGGAGPTR